jgi:hypothetical protein
MRTSIPCSGGTLYGQRIQAGGQVILGALAHQDIGLLVRAAARNLMIEINGGAEEGRAVEISAESEATREN